MGAEMNLSNHFTLEEAIRSSTAERKGIDNSPSQTNIDNMVTAAAGMERIRGMLGYPIQVDSWYRCPELNEAVGGAKESSHMDGYAIDFICPAYGSPKSIVEIIVESNLTFDKCIYEGTWVHISFDPQARRKVMTAHFGPNGTTYTQGAQ